MKKTFKTIVVTFLMVLMLALSMLPAFAAENATVNGKEAKVGDTVTYTFNIQAKGKQNVAGIHMCVFFDQEILELQSVNADNLTGNLIVNDNQNKDGQIIITNSMINGATGLDIKEKTTLATVSFKVLKAEETEITYYMPYLYDIDLVNIYDYTFTYNLTVGDTAVITDQAPILAEGDELDKVSDKGDFQNNADGVGGGKPKKPVNKTLVITISVVTIIVAAIAALIVAKIMMDKKNKTA